MKNNPCGAELKSMGRDWQRYKETLILQPILQKKPAWKQASPYKPIKGKIIKKSKSLRPD